jgi:hypothetical protein
MDKFRCWFLIFTVSASSSFGQDADSLAITEINTIFSSEDSLTIFSLIDSLLAIDAANSSQLAIRTSYNSNVLSAGRTLGIQNFGLAPGLSYYHKTGFYADISAYWSKDFVPSYYLTVVSLGYMHDFKKWFSIMAGFDKYFYRLDDGENYIPYRNSLSVTPIIEFKPVSISINYSYYFGDQGAHRIMPGISLILEKKKLWKIDRVAITPSFFPLWGNEVFTILEMVPPSSPEEARQNRRMYGSPDKPVLTEKKVFGLMNHAISVPINISYNQWGISFSYTYNIPKALPGEPATLSESTFLSGSLIYLINLKRKKSPL